MNFDNSIKMWFSNATPEIELQSLEQINGFYNFQITRIAEHPSVQWPADTLLEIQYNFVSSIKKYEIMFFSKGNQISIKDDSIIGHTVYLSNKLIKYDLSKGLFAGGRFYVWVSGDSLEAELTTYGSVVPIIISERGTLVKDKK